LDKSLPDRIEDGTRRRRVHKVTGTLALVLLSGLLALGGCKDKNKQNTGAKSGAVKGGAGAPPPPPGAQGAPGAKGEPKAYGWKCGDDKCDFDAGEDCMVCAKDCGKCNGCQRKVGFGCTNCKCEACVCKKLPNCCKKGGEWGKKCVDACKGPCGGCGWRAGFSGSGGSGPVGKDHKRTWKCGDGKCHLAHGEDCMVCAKDCGKCDGCQVMMGSNCPSCKCEKCVCKKRPSCCSPKGGWDATCAALCKKDCGGCGVSASTKPTGAAPGKVAPPGAPAKVAATGAPKKATGAAPATAVCGDGKCDAKTEDCILCAKDCGACNGCQAKRGPGCLLCKCEACVCKKRPSCCKADARL